MTKFILYIYYKTSSVAIYLRCLMADETLNQSSIKYIYIAPFLKFKGALQ